VNELLLALALANGADLGTACYALSLAQQQAQYVVREQNPLAGPNPSCGRLAGLKGVTTGVSMLAVVHLQRSGHPKMAKIMTFVAIAPTSIGVGFNLRAIRLLRREQGK